MSKQNLKSIVDVASSYPQFSTFVKAIQVAGLANVLNSAGPYTVFAPTNSAFNKVDQASLNSLLNQPELLKRVLLYHVVAGRHPANKLASMNGRSLNTVQGSPLPVTVSNGHIMVGGANVTNSDIKASNGLIDAIDTVLVPPINNHHHNHHLSRRHSYQSDVVTNSAAPLAAALSAPVVSSTASNASVVPAAAVNPNAPVIAANSTINPAIVTTTPAGVTPVQTSRTNWNWLWWLLLILLVLLLLWALFAHRPKAAVVAPVVPAGSVARVVPANTLNTYPAYAY